MTSPGRCQVASTFSDIEAAGIKHNGLYSVNCVNINCGSVNITVLGSPQVFDERILLQFVYTIHSEEATALSPSRWCGCRTQGGAERKKANHINQF